METRCPSCGVAPPATVPCDACEEAYAPFVTFGACPRCTCVWDRLACEGCDAWMRLEEWVVDEPGRRSFLERLLGGRPGLRERPLGPRTGADQRVDLELLRARHAPAADLLGDLRLLHRQAAAAARDGALGAPARLSNVVFMGMGEPLANYRRVVDAVHRLCDAPPAGLGLSQRSVTVSTVGLVPAIHRLADEGLQVTLAVSLHTPDDDLRDTLVPVNTRWPVAEVFAAARHYADVTGRRRQLPVLR